MTNLEITFGAKTDVGNVKQVNQDCFLCKVGSKNKNKFGLFVVCDGLGGLEHGEIASKKTASYFEQWWENKIDRIINTKDNEKLIKESLEKVIIKSNKELLNISREMNAKLGTTTSALFILNNNYYIVHVGDSRIYKVNKRFNQLTEDHTQYEMLRKQGIKNLEHVKRNVLTQCIGVNENLHIYYNKGKIKKNTTFLMCSDGLYNRMNIENVKKQLNNKSSVQNNKKLEKICENIIEDVKKQQERDNITAVVINTQSKSNNKFLKIGVASLLAVSLIGTAYAKLNNFKDDTPTKMEAGKESKTESNAKDTNSKSYNVEEKLKLAREHKIQGEEDEAFKILEEIQNSDKTNSDNLIEILKIVNNFDKKENLDGVNYIDYFLYGYINSVGTEKIATEVKNIIKSQNELPSIPQENVPSGEYATEVELKLENENLKLGHEYYYTEDGTIPNKDSYSSKKYTDSIKIDQSKTIKIIGYNRKGDATEVKTLNYYIDSNLKDYTENLISEYEQKIDINNELSKEDKEKIEEYKKTLKSCNLTKQQVLDIQEKIKSFYQV